MIEISNSRASWREGLHDDIDGVFVDDEGSDAIVCCCFGCDFQILWRGAGFRRSNNLKFDDLKMRANSQRAIYVRVGCYFRSETPPL
jgi:hypothetical protein